MWILLRTEKIRRRDARKYLGAEFRYALHVWKRWRRFGLPNGGIGWANESAAVIQILDLFEDEREAWLEERKLEEQALACETEGKRRADNRSTPRRH